MACKSDSDLEIFETEFAGRIIDLRRFAYDFFVYSAETFNIPSSCIIKWINTENNYVWSNFISVISRLVFRYQIEQRSRWCERFSFYYQYDKLESFHPVSDLWVQMVVYTLKNNYIRTFFNEIEITLALTNELIQFLYSKNCELYLEDLAKLWFDWISIEKRTFERDGGIKAMYEKGRGLFFKLLENFQAGFIKQYYIPYGNFAEEETIKNRMIKLHYIYKEICDLGLEKNKNKMDDPTREINLPIEWFETNESVAFLRRDKTSSSELSGYAASETVPRRELLRLIRATAITDATRSRSLSEEYVGESTRQSIRYFDAHRERNTKQSSYATKEQVPNRMSLRSGRQERTRKSSPVATFIQNLTWGSPKDKTRHSKGSSGKQKKQNSKGSLETKEHAFQKVSLHLEETEQLSENKGTASISTDRAKNRKSSGEKKRSNNKEGASPIGIQTLEQMSLDYLTPKQSGDDQPSVPISPSTNFMKKIPIKPTRDRKGSSGLPLGIRILCPWLEPVSGQLSDSSESKMARENKPSVSVTYNATSPPISAAAIPKNVARGPHAFSSEQKEHDDKYIYSSVEKHAYETVSLDTLEENKPTEQETNDATSPPIRADAIPKNVARDPQASFSEQEENDNQSNSSPVEEHAYETISLVSLEENESNENQPSVSDMLDETDYQDFFAIPKVPPRRRRSSGEQKTPNQCSSSQNMELSFIQLSIDSSDAKSPDENKPDVSK